MMKTIDAWLNTITMYRLAVYYLIALLVVAIALSFARILSFDPFALLFSAGFLVAVCWASNALLARVFKIPANVESSYITALILALIVSPITGYADLPSLAWMGILAMASKYLIAPFGKHIFNPVGISVVVMGLALDRTAGWWIGDAPMLPFVVIGGFLIVRKMQRWGLVLGFFVATLLTTFAFSIAAREPLITAAVDLVTQTPALFFAFIILTEPLTMPPTRPLQLVYGALVGILFSPQLHIGTFYSSTPEVAILVGNAFSYLVSPRQKLILQLKDKIHLGADLWDFVFTPNRAVSFAPGQYMEWTLGHADPDSRGNRRYFTLASSPTEKELRIGVKFPENASSYKRAMLAMDGSARIVAAQLAGDFTLPKDPKQNIVFIAGGIGITPFRSMIQYLLDKREKRPVTLFYSNRTASEIVYTDVFERAERALGIRTIYTLTDKAGAPIGWKGRVGRVDAEMIRAAVPDYERCVFYLSGPNAMVGAFEETLAGMGVHARQIKTDFFPGFA